MKRNSWDDTLMQSRRCSKNRFDLYLSLISYVGPIFTFFPGYNLPTSIVDQFVPSIVDQFVLSSKAELSFHLSFCFAFSGPFAFWFHGMYAQSLHPACLYM